VSLDKCFRATVHVCAAATVPPPSLSLSLSESARPLDPHPTSAEGRGERGPAEFLNSISVGRSAH